MKKLLKKSGSALVWALCAMMVLTLLVAGMLVLSSSYYNSALEDAAMQKYQHNYVLLVLAISFTIPSFSSKTTAYTR